MEVPANERSGGLLTVWSRDNVVVNSVLSNNSWLGIKGTYSSSKLEFVCINVYAPQTLAGKRKLWSELSSLILSLVDISILLIWDFNSVLSPSEKDNYDFRLLETKLFRVFLESSHLSYTPMVNSRFTWFGPTNKKSRLDRALVIVKWDLSGNWLL